MPHINIQCYPKNLKDKQLDDFCKELTHLMVKHLKINEKDLSVQYTEITPENWQAVWDKDIAPNRNKLLKHPGYEM